MSKDLTPISGEIDPGIKELVEVLREGGHDTVSSCEGGPGHSCGLPTVMIKPMYPEAMSQEAQRSGIARLMIREGHHGFGIRIQQENYYQNNEITWKRLPDVIRIELWAKP